MDELFDNGNSTGNNQRPLWLQWVSWILIILGFSWICYLLIADGISVFEKISNFSLENLLWLGVSFLFATISVFNTGVIFYLIIDHYSDKKYSIMYIGRLFFVGQMIRHLPGRFWNVAYQISEARKYFSSFFMIRVNIDFMFIIMGIVLTVSGSILFFFQINLLISILFFLVFLFISLRFYFIGKILSFVIRLIPKKISERFKNIEKINYLSKEIAPIILICLFAWFLYVLSWHIFKKALPGFGEYNMIMIFATYSLAWAIGYISMITPSGLGVRESMFVLLSSSITDAGVLAFLSIFIRVWLMVIDLALFFLFVMIKPKVEVIGKKIT